MSATPEFARPIRLDTLGTAPRIVTVAADRSECAALARRFDLPAIATLDADAEVRRDGDVVHAAGRLRARATQVCVATGEPVAARIDEAFAVRFEPQRDEASEERELDAADLDVIAYADGAIDLGEAVAQSFALALDPFPRIADADLQLRAAGVLTEDEAEAARIAAGPFAALKGLGSA